LADDADYPVVGDCNCNSPPIAPAVDTTALPTVEAPPLVADIHQRDDGMWSIGWHDDAAGPFESRPFAMAVAEQLRQMRR
jgi:hypothetical protein